MTKDFSTMSFVGGFTLGVLFAGAWFMTGNTLLSTFSTSSSSEVKNSSLESGAVSVIDQPAGSSVNVESVTVPPPGVWVAVREVVGSDLGNVLGAARVNGPQSSLAIPLLRATEPGQSYAIQLYRDDGNGVFDLATDSVYVDFGTGAPVIVHFKTTN